MQILEDTPQGSASWHAARATRFCASEAAAAMGMSKYTSRTELLNQKATGITEEVTPAKQRLFDAGHQSEGATLPIAEGIAGVDFYPAVGVLDFDGLPLLASFDGIDMPGDVLWENKLLNSSLAQQVEAGELEPHYWAQLEHQLLVSGANKALFTTSDGTEEGTRHLWYTSDPARRSAVVAAWKQFAADLAGYVPPAAAAPALVAAPVQALPSVVVQVTGEIAIRDNFAAFETALRDFLEHRLIRKPTTDQDFADLDVQIKAMKGAEAALDAAETQMLAQIQTVDTAKKTKDMLAQLVRENRLMAEKLLASEKERRRGEIVAVGVKGLADHIAGLNARLGRPYMPAVPVDFGGAIKGKKSLASMEDAVATTLANAKIQASATADKIEANLKTLAAAEPATLFPDTAQLVLKAADDLAAVIASRIAAHKAAEEEKAAAKPAEPSPAAAPSVTQITPAAARQVVVEQQDVISAFLGSRTWGRGEEAKARAVLVEFEKFKAGYQLRKAA